MIDAAKNDPSIPRVVTLEPAYDGFFERTSRFPDGSVTIEIVQADGSAVVAASATPFPRDTPPGADTVASRLAASHGGRLCHDGAGWWAFDGTLWRRRAITRVIVAALREAGVADPWPGLVAAVEQFARQDPSLRMEPTLASDAAWDDKSLLLGTPGGTLDLATGMLRPADPADRITRSTAVTPSPEADCPLWRRFLVEAMEGDEARVIFLQRFCGYALTGETCEHALVFAYGTGGNGKSVFANTLRGLLGTYAAVAAPDLFTQRSEHRTNPALSAAIASLAGARLVTAAETEEGRTWADGRLKLLTGGDPVTARFLGANPFTFTPRFKLLVTGNHRPALRTVDAALRRRLHLVPFAHVPAAPDRRLEAKLRAEGPAILRWMIEGCLAWGRSPDEPGEGGGLSGGIPGGRSNGLAGGLACGLAGGLLRPAAVATATERYLDDEDDVGQFLAECCERNPRGLETAAALYAAWCAYAQAAGEPPGTQRRLAAGLERHGLTRERAEHARFYRGVRLLREGERAADVNRARGG